MSRHFGTHVGEQEQLLTRRSLLATTAAIAAGSIIASKLDVDLFPGGGESIDKPYEANENYMGDFAASNPFEHGAAQEVADKLSITSGDYYKLSPETVETVSKSGLFRTETEMAPIFFPEVMDKQKYLENAANEFNIPVNVFASLASIESAGLPAERSGADAYGIVQVVPYYHYDKFSKYLPEDASLDDYYSAKAGGPSNVSLDTYQGVFTDPKINTLAGAEYFAECIEAAREYASSLDENSMIIYALAASAYNGGAGNMRRGFEGMPLESQLYVNHVARILLDVETALTLRKEGHSDEDILKAMKSKHMDAMAYSYSEQSRSSSSLDAYEAQAITISEAKAIAQLPTSMSAPYLAYDKGDVNNYQTPMAPGLRIWFAGGGDGLFKRSDANMNWAA